MFKNFNISKFMENDFVAVILGLLVILYAWRIQIDLPEGIRKLFSNDILL